MASASAATHRTLIVANRTAGTPLLLQEVGRRAVQEPTAFVLLIPDVSSKKAADWTLKRGAEVLAARGAGTDRPSRDRRRGPRRRRGPVRVDRANARRGNFDDVVISTLPKRTSQWLKRDLPARVEKLGLPVTVITAPKAKRMTLEESGIYGGGFG